MDAQHDLMILALLDVSRFCETCQGVCDPKIDDCFIVCSDCGRIKRKVFDSKTKRKKKPVPAEADW